MSHLHRFIGILGLSCLWFAVPQFTHAQPTSPEKQWAINGPGGTPSFSKHIVPMFTRTGCNNRSCHGSFQGKGGFRLSLFGYEPDLDYRGLIKDEEAGPRVEPKQVDRSLALLKPLGKLGHKGGKRFEENSWQHRMFRQWIAAGAKYNAKTEARLQRLELTPKHIRFTDKDSEKLKVVAHFSDGDIVNVTSLAMFSGNDDSVARVDNKGIVTRTGTGSTSLVIKYGGGIATLEVVVPNTEVNVAAFPANNKIDELTFAKWQQLGIQPSELCSDEEFLRRVHVDLIGTLPTPEEVRTFLTDKRADKREKVIDALLQRPEYGMYWATIFSDWLGNNTSNINNAFKMTVLFHDWLKDKLDRNMPYDQLVGGIVTATSREGRPLKEYLKENKAVEENLKPRDGHDDGTYAKRKTLDLYWMRRVPDRPKELAIRTANAFLGVQIQCAECHNHPFDRWTQKDFEGFTSFFRCVDICDLDGSPRSKSRYDYHLVALYPQAAKREVGMIKRYPPKILGGAVVEYKENGKDPRLALHDWMVAKDNPYFARNIVNRLWHHHFGVGIVDPVDDLSEANPPSNKELLDWLAKDFIDHKFDLKKLHKRILMSRTYQLSHKPNSSNRTDTRHFSHNLVHRLPAEVALDAICQVTGTTLRLNGYAARPNPRAIGLAASTRYGKSEYFL